MKYCKNCGAENNDENSFCFNCRSSEFSDTKPENTNRYAPPPPPPPVINPNPNMPNPNMPRPYQQPVYYSKPQKKPLTIPDLLSILGFVAAIVGMFSASVILHPIAAISSITGFVKGSRFKPLAVAGFIISVVGGLVYIILSLYRSGLIPEWITFGAFH